MNDGVPKAYHSRSSPSLLELRVLLCGEVDVDAAASPSADIVVELLKARTFGMTANDESAEFVECGEGEVTRLRPNGCPAIGLDEVNNPVAAMVEVHQDDGHGLVLSAGAANASLHSAVLGVVGVLGCEHVAGEANEDFAGTVAAMLSFGKASPPAGDVSATTLALDHENGRVHTPLLTVMHAHRVRVYSE